MSINGITSAYGLDSTSAARSSMFAQREKPDASKAINELTTKLGLSDEQASKLKSILEQNLSETSSSSIPDRSEMQSRMEKTDNAIKDMLTDEQKVKFEEITAERKSNMGDKAGKMPPPPPPSQSSESGLDSSKFVSQLTAQLGLNDNQMSDVKKILNKSMTEIQDSMQSGSNISQDTIDEKLESMNESINSLLSEDQQKKFSSMQFNLNI